MARMTVDQWFAEYGVCHQDRVNKAVHWVCVPSIAASLIGMLWSIPFPGSLPWANWAVVAVVAGLIFYLRLSLPLALGMAVCSAAVIGLVVFYEKTTGRSVLIPSIVLFVVAWIGQFIGHRIEGKRPAFFQDLQFLLIGPIWVLDEFYQKVGIGRRSDQRVS